MYVAGYLIEEGVEFRWSHGGQLETKLVAPTQ
jgi:hypothetical protein